MLNAPESLSATEQEIVIESVGCKTNFPPDKTSKLEPTGIGTLFSSTAVPLGVLPLLVPAPTLFVCELEALALPVVSDSSRTLAVT